MRPTLTSVVSAYGSQAKAKLSSAAVGGEPEDQLRAPFEMLLAGFGELLDMRASEVTAVGETTVTDLNTRPDYAVTVKGALTGFVELKAPGKGADPRAFRDRHDKEQWERLRLLPNVLYSDGNAFGLWRDGELVGSVVTLTGDIETSGTKLEAPDSLLALFQDFLTWRPIPPRSAKELAHTSARLCRLLRNEVTDQLALGSAALTTLATDWRKLLFPDATDERFADGFAQAVTFGLLMARAKKIDLATGMQRVSEELAKSNSLIGAALRLLTDSPENRATLKTSLGTLTRVLNAVDWERISRGEADAWLYFYEDFLGVYDNKLRKQTGSYYTPPEVVAAMVHLVDEILRSDQFRLHAGLASPAVTLADPAVGTGTFLLGVLRKIATTTEADEGAGAVPASIEAALSRLIAFEIQLGPFAVAQLRILAEIVELTGSAPKVPVRMYVTDTLGNPNDAGDWIPGILAPIADSRRDANKIKREEPITVVIGNPPYKEKAKGRGGWVEGEDKLAVKSAPLTAWLPPRDWKVGAHAKHLRNLYVFFWRWATWKVFDHHPASRSGVVCFITVAGFLGGPGFQKMRDYLRRTCDEIWVIDCSPEGHQPEVNTRIFEGVQQPVCIVLASRSTVHHDGVPARVRFRALPPGPRTTKFEALQRVSLNGEGWAACPLEWREPFLPAPTGAWATFPRLESLFSYSGSGVQPKRTWVIAPDADSLARRWSALTAANVEQKEHLFHPTLRDGKPADRHIRSVVREAIPGYEPVLTPLLEERRPCSTPVRYAFRSFNRQWIIPDARVITQPNAELWASRSAHQVYLTALTRSSPTSGPALTFCADIPDLDHYKGSFGGRAFPLWRDSEARTPNVLPALLSVLGRRIGQDIGPEDLVAYVAAVAAHPGFAARFRSDLATPGLRLPITAVAGVFHKAVELGRTVIWLHTFGERMVDAAHGRPAGAPRLPAAKAPRIPKAGAIPSGPDGMPDVMEYDATAQRLHVGLGFVENVPPAVWNYEVSGKQVLPQWFSYRRKNRERPIIGDRRPPSPLGDIQPESWPAEYTTELLNVLNVLGGLVVLEPTQAALLDEICAGSTITQAELQADGAFQSAESMTQRHAPESEGPRLFPS